MTRVVELARPPPRFGYEIAHSGDLGANVTAVLQWQGVTRDTGRDSEKIWDLLTVQELLFQADKAVSRRARTT